MKIPLEPAKYYHIYNHANGKENLFVNDGNYIFFLEKYSQHINPVADTFAYCLMPNHFHFAVRIKSEQEILDNLSKPTNQLSKRELSKSFKLLESSILESSGISKYLSKQFSNLFSSYTQSFNNQQTRRGSLFTPNFSRKHINTDEYCRQIIHYIHFNPVHHQFAQNLKDWKYTSYKTFFSEKPTNIKRKEVIEMFEDIENFYFYHQKEIDDNLFLDLEDF